MTRYDSSTNQAEGELPAVTMFVAVDLDFVSGHIRAHDGIGKLSFGGNDYEGVGSFAGIEVCEESVDVVGNQLVLTLSGVDPALITTARTEIYQGREAVVYVGFMNRETNAVLATPETLWQGLMDQMTIKLGAAEGSIRLTCENDIRREPGIARYTDADLQLQYPGDRFFDLIGKIAGFRGTWGQEGIINSGGSLLPFNSSPTWNGY